MRMRDAMIAMVLGVVAGVIASFAERADSAITGGNATPLGYINTYTWLLVSAPYSGLSELSSPRRFKLFSD